MRRRIVGLTLALVLLLSAMAPAAFAVSYGTVKTAQSFTYVRLRSGPGPYAVVALVGTGAKLQIYGVEKNWYRVKVVATGEKGYIYKDYISTDGGGGGGSTSGVSLGFTGKAGTVKASSVKLKRGASNSSGTVVTLKKGTKLALTGTAGNFYKVKVLSTKKTGYVAKSAVTLGISAKTKGTVNIRAAGSTAARAIGMVGNGKTITLLVAGSEWSRIRYGKVTGYINNKYIKR